ncbi:unnamed protein product [Candidula unifasciata]|uniref:FAD-binding PCMH-type domain-containing protein n=1 Tax=Candidula unifasciata TaxID=100452 RepID=A0A8S3YJS2_9EUPU|nr:unnamed protein product [Candidula unifasciata]
MSKNGTHKDWTYPSMVVCPVCAASHLPRKDNLANGVYACTCVNCGHFFKFRTVQNFKSSVSFTINGTQYTAGNEYNPATSLNDFMRLSRASMGTKGSCYEGGCGVCLVTVKLYDPVSQQNVEYAVNSCCLQLFACDGFEITTIEGLGNPRKGLHVIQERLVEHDGAQCGYCSPAQVMNMYGLLQKNPTVTVQQVEDEFDATICRCTGYRSILDAMKTFAVDAPQNLKGKVVDIEDLDAKLCKKTGKSCSGHCKTTGHSDHSCSNQIAKPVHIVGANGQWFKPTSLSELQAVLLQYANNNYRLVFGNTGFGLYQELGPWNFDILIDIRAVQELYTVKLGSTIVLGANLSLQNLIDIFEQKATDPSVPYASAFVQHLKITAQHGIRNMSSWAGNLMLKRAHLEFPSDIFVLLETVSAQLTIVDANGVQSTCSCAEFLNVDMKGKVIISASLPTYSGTGVQVRTYKTSSRLQASQAFINAGFNFNLDANNNFLVKSRPSIVLQGINSALTHAVQTEAFLVNKALGDPAVLQGALSTLSSELTPDTFPLWTDPSYRRSLAISLFYKFVLDVCQSKADARYASGGQGLVRTPMVGTQDYDTDQTKWPLTEPMKKITAPYLATGVVQYLDDLPLAPGELCASVVISTEGSATIDTVDASAALAVPGVVAFIQASDIPAGGVNNWRPYGIFGDFKEELLSTGTILYAGQPIGIVVADLQTTADTAAALVKVTYKNVQIPIVDIQTAIKQKSFFPNPPPPVVSGNAAAAIAASPKKISGSVGCGSQYQFHLEPQLTICTPTDVGGMKVKTTTQWIDGSLESVAQVLGLQQSDVTVEVERLGGAFGGKITQNFLVSGLCALAAYVVGRTVKMRVDIHTNMKMLGKRTPYYAEYQVGSDVTGKLTGVIITLYGDEGWGLTDVESSMFVQDWFDNAYYCPNWLFTPIPLKTNKPVNTGCRAPGSAPFIFVMESIMEHLAKSLQLDPLAVKQLNLYTSGQKDPAGMVLNYVTIGEIVTQLKADINYNQRIQAVNDFNKANRWKKRGLAVMPMRFAIMWSGSQFNSHVIIHHGDGSVSVAHGGIDVGQGINTKIIQVCAYELGIPMSKIRVKKSSSTINANSYTTGGSITTELCCIGVIESCRILKDRMAPVKAAMGGNPSWEDLVARCYQLMVNLTASYVTHQNDPFAAHYSSYSATCAEAELDVLTGQYQLRQLDMLYDCGDSMNPELDIGQVEGGFAMGLGYFLQEDLKYDPKTGEVLTAGTWDYKPPLPKDLPMNLNFKFLKKTPNPIGVLGSKAVGEPPLVTAAACLFAIKHAVEAARAETAQDTFFSLSAPATVDKVQALCLNNISSYTYGK